MAAPATVAARLPALAADALRGLYVHRLLSTSQVRELFAPATTERWVQMTLTDMERRGLVHHVGHVGRRERVWFLAAGGHRAVEGPGIERRPYRMTPEVAGGPQQAHTVAGNEIGLCFRRAALALGDDFSTEAWRHEVAYPLGPGRAERLIVDVQLDYLAVLAERDLFMSRFVEVDRATSSVRTLAAKFASYRRLHAYPAGWMAEHPVAFPKLIVVVVGDNAAAIGRRILALRETVARLALPAALAPSAVTLADLQRHGPFAPIFTPLAEASPPVNVMGLDYCPAR